MGRRMRMGGMVSWAALAALEAVLAQQPPRLLALQPPAPGGAPKAAGATDEPAERPREGLRRMFNEARSLSELWDNLEYEREVGAHDNVLLYVDRINTLLASMDPATRQRELDVLLKTADFTKLQSLQGLPVVVLDSGDPDLSKKLRKGLDTFAATLQDHLRAQQSPEKLQEFTDRLLEGPTAFKAVMKELSNKGGFAVKPLLDLGRRTTDETQARDVTRALLELPPASLPGLIGALDVPDRDWQRRVARVIALRAEIGDDMKSALPALELLLADDGLPVDTRIGVTAVVANLRKTHGKNLPPAADMLADTALRLYRHQVPLEKDSHLQIFHWQKGKGLVPGAVDGATTPVVSPAEAEQYWGMRAARKALEIQSGSRQARHALLGLWLENEAARQKASGKPFQLLAVSQPALLELLTGQDSPMLVELLREALTNDRQAVALGLLEALASRGDEMAGLERGNTISAYEMALESGEPRLRLAAAMAIARLPKPPSARVAARVVHVLAGFLTQGKPQDGQVRARVLMSMDSPDLLDELSHSLVAARYQVDGAVTARETMQRLLRGPDHDLLVVDGNIADIDLNHLLAQMGAEGPLSRMPVLVIAMPSPRQHSCLSVRFQDLEARRVAIEQELRQYHIEQKAKNTRQQAELAELDALYETIRKRNKGTLDAGSTENYDTSREQILERQKDEDKAFQIRFLPQFQLEGELATVRRGLTAVQTDFVIASREREDKLTRHLAPDKRVHVIRPGALGKPGAAVRTISATLNETRQIPLGPQEQILLANQAAELLAGMASGRIHGYDIRPAGKAMEVALGGDILTPPSRIAITQAIASLPGGSAQARLMGMAADPARPAPERFAAAEALARHVQRNGRLTTNAQVKALEDSLPEIQDPQVRARVSGALTMLSRPGGDKKLLDYKPRVAEPRAAEPQGEKPPGEGEQKPPAEKAPPENPQP